MSRYAEVVISKKKKIKNKAYFCLTSSINKSKIKK